MRVGSVSNRGFSTTAGVRHRQSRWFLYRDADRYRTVIPPLRSEASTPPASKPRHPPDPSLGPTYRPVSITDRRPTLSNGLGPPDIRLRINRFSALEWGEALREDGAGPVRPALGYLLKAPSSLVSGSDGRR
jgi:hypothetical protein